MALIDCANHEIQVGDYLINTDARFGTYPGKVLRITEEEVDVSFTAVSSGRVITFRLDAPLHFLTLAVKEGEFVDATIAEDCPSQRIERNEHGVSKLIDCFGHEVKVGETITVASRGVFATVKSFDDNVVVLRSPGQDLEVKRQHFLHFITIAATEEEMLARNEMAACPSSYTKAPDLEALKALKGN